MSAEPDSFLAADPSEPERAAELRRIKLLATAVLVGAVALLIVAKLLQPRYPAFGFVAAFAEAAAIGGIADWYAVVALFRHPLGLPIPHTAIIQHSRERIAEKFGAFIELHFLAAAPVEAKLREVDFAMFAADWLADRKRSGELARFVLRMLPDALSAAETSGLTAFLSRRLLAYAQSLDVAPLVANAVRATVRDGRHAAIFNDLLFALHKVLLEPRTLAALRDKIRDELPALLKLYRADRFLLQRIMTSLQTFLWEVYHDAGHPFRAEFDQMMLSFADSLESDPAYAGRLRDFKRDLLAKSRVTQVARILWDGVRGFLERSARGQHGVLLGGTTSALVEIGRQLDADAALRREMNDGCVVVLRSFVAAQRQGVSRFIADQVKAWDMSRLVELIELNIGKDLQYIRFNGALIGGLAGLTLYWLQVLLRLA